ncbi:hypothetical protein LRN76_14490, partial [Escherichia coli]|nr:hypothetical protein [Escherichia coli]
HRALSEHKTLSISWSHYPQTQSLMVLPFSHADTQFKNVPSTFQVGYINDFGGLSFYEINCPTVNNSCNVSVAKRDK